MFCKRLLTKQNIGNSNITFLSHFNNNFNDYAIGSTDSDSPTNYGVTFSSSEKKFGTHSAYFDNSSYIEWPNHPDYHLGNNFTISCWIKRLNVHQSYFLGRWQSGSKSWVLMQGLQNRVGFYISHNGSTFVYIASPEYPNDNAWHHIEVTYDGSWIRVFIDGELKESLSYNSGIYAGTIPLCIGRIPTHPSYYYYGYIDEVMIMNNYCLHTENFTPPTEPYK